jgi:uncharacterized protein HemY
MLLILGSAFLFATAAAPKSPTPEALMSVVELVYQGRLGQARETLSELCQKAQHDPRCDMIAARIAAEALPDATSEGSRIAKAAQPVLTLVRAAAAKAAATNPSGLSELELHFVRGWSAMVEAQMLALSGSYLAAGSASKRAKSELDQVLKQDPNHSDAKGLTGAYQYFAARLPGLVKLVKWLLRFPGGDRGHGLKWIAEASAGHGYLSTDMRLLGIVIDANFEGDWERSLPAACELARSYPSNETMVKYAVLMARYDPDQWPEAERLADRSIQQVETFAEGATRAAILRLLRSGLSLARGERESARRDLEELLASKAQDPSWVIPHAELVLGLLALEEGKRQELHSRLEQAARRDRGKWFRSFLSNLAESEVPAARIRAHREAAALLAQMNRHGAQGVEELIGARLDGESGAPLRHYLLGELARRRGDWEAAERDYRRCLSYRGPDLQLVRYQAKLLWASACERRGDLRMAAGIWRDLSIDPLSDPFGAMALRARAELLQSRAGARSAAKK